MQTLEQIIELCKKNDRDAQKKLYDIYSPVLYGICIRYVAEKSEAKDILQDGFLKILLKISNFNGNGSFEGWMKRIMVNTAITHYHRNKRHSYHYEIEEIQEIKIDGNQYRTSDFTMEELTGIIQNLPPGYKMVFNLYAIEEYKHKEIAEKMQIDVNTSKSQYSRAKKLIQKKLKDLSKIKLHVEK